MKLSECCIVYDDGHIELKQSVKDAAAKQGIDEDEAKHMFEAYIKCQKAETLDDVKDIDIPVKAYTIDRDYINRFMTTIEKIVLKEMGLYDKLIWGDYKLPWWWDAIIRN